MLFLTEPWGSAKQIIIQTCENTTLFSEMRWQMVRCLYFLSTTSKRFCLKLVGIHSKIPEFCDFHFFASFFIYSPWYQDQIPTLASHFSAERIETHMFASQWFLTLYSSKFPLHTVYRILDLFLCEVRVCWWNWWVGVRGSWEQVSGWISAWASR